MTRIDMDGIEIEEFLESRRTGVLSLGRDNDGYGVPLSFYFDPSDAKIYFHLGYAPGSQKEKFIDSAEDVTFVVYDQTDEGWKSVLAEGRLEVLAEGAIDSDIEQATRHLDIPYFEVHDRPISALEYDIVRLDVSKLNGIAEGYADS